MTGGNKNALNFLKDAANKSNVMTKKEKLWQKAKNNPENLTFDEFETLLSQNGWEFSRQKGSHRLWYSPNGQPLPIQPRKDGKAKLYQIQQFFEYQEVEE